MTGRCQTEYSHRMLDWSINILDTSEVLILSLLNQYTSSILLMVELWRDASRRAFFLAESIFPTITARVWPGIEPQENALLRDSG
jgi:hypothetical protein